MKAGTLFFLTTFLGSTALAEDVTVHDGARAAGTCDTENSITLTWDGTEGSQIFWESFSHDRDEALYIALKGSRIDMYPNGATLSCTDEAAWRRLSEVVPNNGEEVVTYLGECDISVPSKPHRFQIAFTPRYADVTREGTSRQEKVVRTFDNGNFSERKIPFPRYGVRNYREMYTSCLSVVVR